MSFSSYHLPLTFHIPHPHYCLAALLPSYLSPAQSISDTHSSPMSTATTTQQKQTFDSCTCQLSAIELLDDSSSQLKSTQAEPRLLLLLLFSAVASAYGSLALVSTSFNPRGEAPADVDDASYPFNHLKPHFPEVSWPALTLRDVKDRGLSAPSLGKPRKENLVLKKATKWQWSTPALGVEIWGVDLKELTTEEKDDL
jgi:hypothetical protein